MQVDEEEAKILDKIIKDIIKKASTLDNNKKSFSTFTRQGVYIFKENKWEMTSSDKRWKPKEDGLYVIFDDDFDYPFLLGPFGEPFLKVAEHVEDSVKAIVRTFSNFKAPYLTFTCIEQGKELFSKTFDALPWLSDVATLVAYFGLNCPSVKRKDLDKVSEICPCAKLW